MVCPPGYFHCIIFKIEIPGLGGQGKQGKSQQYAEQEKFTMGAIGEGHIVTSPKQYQLFSFVKKKAEPPVLFSWQFGYI
jgi:hypothetical protein